MKFALLALALGCGASLEQLRARELCYSHAESAAQARVDAECAEGLAACASTDDIFAELQRSQEACE